MRIKIKISDNNTTTSGKSNQTSNSRLRRRKAAYFSATSEIIDKIEHMDESDFDFKKTQSRLQEAGKLASYNLSKY